MTSFITSQHLHLIDVVVVDGSIYAGFFIDKISLKNQWKTRLKSEIHRKNNDKLIAKKSMKITSKKWNSL